MNPIEFNKQLEIESKKINNKYKSSSNNLKLNDEEYFRIRELMDTISKNHYNLKVNDLNLTFRRIIVQRLSESLHFFGNVKK